MVLNHVCLTLRENVRLIGVKIPAIPIRMKGVQDPTHQA